MIRRIAAASVVVLASATLVLADVPAPTPAETVLPPAPPEKIEGRSVDAAREGEATVPALGVIAAQGPAQVLASEVIGRPVTSNLGEEVGEIEDILLDATGRVAGVVLSMGGTLGIGARHVALSWDQLERHPDKPDVFVVSVAAEQLRAAPEFTPLEPGAGRDPRR